MEIEDLEAADGLATASYEALCGNDCFYKVSDIVAVKADLNDVKGVQNYIFGIAGTDGTSNGADMVRIVRYGSISEIHF